MKIETFKITNINDAIKMLEEMKDGLTLKVVSDYMQQGIKATNNKEYRILGTKIVKGAEELHVDYLITNDECRDVWVAAEYIELI